MGTRWTTMINTGRAAKESKRQRVIMEQVLLRQGLTSAAESLAPMTPLAGWYGDPSGQPLLRWWDGRQWTEHTHVPAVPNAPTTDVVAVSTSVPVSRPVVKRPAGRRRKTTPTLTQMVSEFTPYPSDLDLDEQIEVAGETYHIKGIRAVYREVGMPISDQGSTIENTECALLPEPWNEHDPNAVAVMIGPHHVGYVPAEMAVDYATPLGRLAANNWMITGRARLWAKDDGGMIRARVTVLAPAADDLVSL